MPGGSDSPTGRMPQDRSLIPHHRSGVTSSVSPSTVIDPVHCPVCAIRLESNTTRSWRADEVLRLDLRRDGPLPGEVERQPELVRVEHHAEPLEALENL